MGMSNFLSGVAAALGKRQADEKRAAVQTARQKLAKYREILGRQDTPEPGDAEWLIEYATERGLTPEQIVSDGTAQRKFLAADKILQGDERALQRAVGNEIANIEALTKKHSAELEAAVAVRDAAQREVEKYQAAQYAMRDLKRQHPRLLGDVADAAD